MSHQSTTLPATRLSRPDQNSILLYWGCHFIGIIVLFGADQKIPVWGLLAGVGMGCRDGDHGHSVYVCVRNRCRTGGGCRLDTVFSVGAVQPATCHCRAYGTTDEARVLTICDQHTTRLRTGTRSQVKQKCIGAVAWAQLSLLNCDSRIHKSKLTSFCPPVPPPYAAGPTTCIPWACYIPSQSAATHQHEVGLPL